MPRLSLADARALARAALARAHAAEPMLGGQAFQAWLGSHSMARARLGCTKTQDGRGLKRMQPR